MQCVFSVATCRLVVPKSYQREGQPRKTENEFSHDLHRESDDSGIPRWLSLSSLKYSNFSPLLLVVLLLSLNRWFAINP